MSAAVASASRTAQDERKERPEDEEEDSADARLYAETRGQLQELNRQLFGVQQQALLHQRRIRRNQLTLAELAKFGDDVPAYKPVGGLPQEISEVHSLHLVSTI